MAFWSLLVLLIAWSDLSYCFEAVTLHRIPSKDEHVKRETHLSNLFAPRDKALWPYFNTSQPHQIVTITLQHPRRQWVDLEHVEPYLVDRRVVCDPNAKLHQSTFIRLRFNESSTYTIAKSQWLNKRGLFLTVEDVDCFQGPGERSVYKLESLATNDERNAIRLRARPMFAHFLHGNDWVDNYHVTLGPTPEDMEIQTRRMAPETQGGPQLQRRALPDFHKSVHLDFNKTWEAKHNLLSVDKVTHGHGDHIMLPVPDIDCINCKVVGEIDVSVDVVFKKKKDSCIWARDLGSKTVEHEYFRLLPQINKHLEKELAMRKQQLQGLQKRASCNRILSLLIKCDRPKDEDDDDDDYEDHDVGTDDENEDEREKCDTELQNFWYDHPLQHIGQCVKNLIRWKLHCVKDAFEDLGEIQVKEMLKSILAAHVETATACAEVKKPVDVDLQLSISMQVHLRISCDIDYVPPSYINLECQIQALLQGGSPWNYKPGGKSQDAMSNDGEKGGFWVKDDKKKGSDAEKKKPPKTEEVRTSDRPNFPSSEDDDDSKKPNKPPKSTLGGISVHNMPWVISPLSFNVQMGIDAKINFTLPGFRVQIPQGRMEYDFVQLKMLENTIRPNITYRYGDVHLENPALRVTTALGAKAKIDIIPAGKAEGSIAGAMDKFGAGKPLGLSARLDVAKFEYKLNETWVDNMTEDCAPCQLSESNCAANRGQFTIIFRIGGTVTLKIFFFSIDSVWAGKLDHGPDATPGLYWSRAIYARCFDVPVGITQAKHGFTDFLHEILHKAQEPIAKGVEKIGPAIARLGNDGDEEGWVGAAVGLPDEKGNQTTGVAVFPQDPSVPTDHLVAVVANVTELAANGTMSATLGVTILGTMILGSTVLGASGASTTTTATSSSAAGTWKTVTIDGTAISASVVGPASSLGGGSFVSSGPIIVTSAVSKTAAKGTAAATTATAKASTVFVMDGVVFTMAV